MFRLITLVLLLFPMISFSQWDNAGNNYTTGRLGIGTSNPGFQLEIRKSTSPYFLVCRDASPGNDSYSYNMMSPSYYIFGSNKNGTGVLRKIGFAIGGSDSEADVKLTIDVNGKVGIGASAPLARFHTVGSIYSSATRTNSVFSGTVGTDNANFIGSEGFWALRTATNNSFNLDVYNSASPLTALTVLQSGFTGIGTNAPQDKLTVAGNLGIYGTGLDGSSLQRTVVYSNSTYGLLIEAPKNASGSKMNIEFNWRGGGTTPFMINGATSNVGIGTSNPDAKLTVAGNIHSREVKVAINAGADFVFNDDYKPISLTELEKFIREKRHLPEIPSAEQMEREGLELGAMNIRLLKKIEEMTLYILDLKTENESLKTKGEAIQREYDMLAGKLEALTVFVDDLKAKIEQIENSR